MSKETSDAKIHALPEKYPAIATSPAEGCFKQKKPERTCAGCGLKTEKEKLIRFALSPVGDVISDENCRAHGRGVYFCRDEKCFARGIKKQAFSKGLKKEAAESDLTGLFEKLCPGAGDYLETLPDLSRTE